MIETISRVNEFSCVPVAKGIVACINTNPHENVLQLQVDFLVLNIKSINCKIA